MRKGNELTNVENEISNVILGPNHSDFFTNLESQIK